MAFRLTKYCGLTEAEYNKAHPEMLDFWCNDITVEQARKFRPFLKDILPLTRKDAVQYTANLLTKLEETNMATRRNTKKATTGKPKYGADINLWYADDNASYVSRGEIKFTRSHIEELLTLFEEFATEDSFKGEDVLRVPFFLRAALHYSDEFGSLATQLVRDREVE